MILKNKKGLTLVELLICVVMISGLMLLMYKLISSINTKRKQAENIGDIVLRGSEVTSTLEQIISSQKIIFIKFDNSNKLIEFYNESSLPLITVKYTENGMIRVFTNDGSVNQKWTFDKTQISMCSVQDPPENPTAINIYLTLKQSNKVIGTIEFPYYSKDGFAINGVIECQGE